MPSSDRDKKILRVAIAHPVTQWDPVHAQDAASHFVLAQLYEPPFTAVLVGEAPEPALFDGPLEESTFGVRGRRYRGTVKPMRRFSDGSEVTAARIAASLQRSGMLGEGLHVSADGDAVVFESDRPRPRLSHTLAKRWCAVTLARDGEFHGTGAFMRAPDSTPEHIRLVRNPYHHRTTAIDEIEFEVFGPERERELAAALEGGRIHLTLALDARRARTLRDVETAIRPGDSTGILYFNTRRLGLETAATRRALAAAVDRFKLTRIAYPEAAGMTAKGITPPSLGKFRDDHRFDRERARPLASRWGEANPLRMLVVWAPRPYLPAPREVADEIQRQLASVGISVALVHPPNSADYSARLRAGDYDLVLGGWIAESPEPGDFFESLVATAAIPTKTSSTAAAGNFSRWSDPLCDSALDEYRDDGDARHLEEVAARIASEVPFLPLMHGAFVATWSTQLIDFVPGAAYVPRLANVDLD